MRLMRFRSTASWPFWARRRGKRSPDLACVWDRSQNSFRSPAGCLGQAVLAGLLVLCLSGHSYAAPNCTLFASPNGRANNVGTTVDKPLSLRGAVEATKPGSVVCLLAGTYYVSTPFEITRSGTESNWVVY